LVQRLAKDSLRPGSSRMAARSVDRSARISLGDRLRVVHR
jgi:hypothetical protein